MQRKRESDWNCVDSITFEILHFNWVRARCTSKMKYRSGHHKKKGEDDLSQYKYNTQIQYKYNTSTIQVLYKFNTSTIQVQYKYNTKKKQRKETYHNQWDEVEFVPCAAHCVIRLERESNYLWSMLIWFNIWFINFHSINLYGDIIPIILPTASFVW